MIRVNFDEWNATASATIASAKADPTKLKLGGPSGHQPKADQEYDNRSTNAHGGSDPRFVDAIDQLQGYICTKAIARIGHPKEQRPEQACQGEGETGTAYVFIHLLNCPLPIVRG